MLVNRQLIIDFDVTNHGHNIGYVTIILNYVHKHNLSNKYVFLFNEFAEKMLVGKIPKINELEIYYPTNDDSKKLNLISSDFKRRDFEWQIIERYTNKLKIDSINCLHIDQYFPSLILRGSKLKISGIYFRPSTRIYIERTTVKSQLLSLLKLYRKRILEKLLVSRIDLGKLFILNDKKSTIKLNKELGTYFSYLPDPIFNLDKPIKNIGLRSRYSIDSNQLVFLVFGAMSPRKNLENILKAFGEISSEFYKDITLLIVGKVIKTYTGEFYRLIGEAKEKKKDFKIIVDERFIDDDEVDKLFIESDVILIPYKDLYTSSGILGTSARHNKPCVVSNIGLLSELVDEYKLGVKVNPFSYEDIKDKLMLFIEQKILKNVDGTDFCKNHSPYKFIKQLLS